ncbi:hypothetical protein KC19_9G033400 [Ceratodon purpureus]|uniref:Uncharacterized protein n=1 Tax=Ceratodon purpureus TaxID=3225 RepID=A0A8T0GQ59_CERPU|nr:hypothetical protein KC19_9G033400 [Ceratodon purpureus]
MTSNKKQAELWRDKYLRVSELDCLFRFALCVYRVLRVWNISEYSRRRHDYIRLGFDEFLVSVRRLKVLRLAWGFVTILIMAGKVTFVNKNDESKSFKFHLYGREGNRVKVATVLDVFGACVTTLEVGSVMEADDDGLSMDTFVAGCSYNISESRTSRLLF